MIWTAERTEWARLIVEAGLWGFVAASLILFTGVALHAALTASRR